MQFVTQLASSRKSIFDRKYLIICQINMSTIFSWYEIMYTQQIEFRLNLHVHVHVHWWIAWYKYQVSGLIK